MKAFKETRIPSSAPQPRLELYDWQELSQPWALHLDEGRMSWCGAMGAQHHVEFDGIENPGDAWIALLDLYQEDWCRGKVATGAFWGFQGWLATSR